jgi:hypothetical protein
MLDFEPSSFAFLAHYLYISCLKLEEKGIQMHHISRELKRCIGFLHTKFSYMKISDKEVEYNRPSDFHNWPEEAIRHNTIDFT